MLAVAAAHTRNEQLRDDLLSKHCVPYETTPRGMVGADEAIAEKRARTQLYLT